MSIAGASEIITGKFWDAGGAFYNAAHPDFGSSNDSVVVSAAITQADDDGGGLVYVPATVTQSAMPTLPTGVAYMQITATGIRWGGQQIFTDRSFIGDGSAVLGADGMLTISGTLTGSGRDGIVVAPTMNGQGFPRGISVNPTFDIATNSAGIESVGFGASAIATNAHTVTYWTGVSVFAPTVSGGGTLTTAYGIKVEDIAIGSTAYAIKTGLGIVDVGGRLNTVASSTASAGLRVPHGTAPTSPTNGDLWTTTGGLFARINGSTVGPFATGLTGSGTANKMVKWSGASAIADSSISDDGTTVTLANGRLTLTQTVAALALRIDQGAGSLTNAILIASGTDTGGGGGIINIAQTWNNVAVVFSGIKMNISATAAHATSKLLKLQVASSDVFSVGLTGAVISAAGLTVNADLNVDAGDLVIAAGHLNMAAGTGQIIYANQGSVSEVALSFAAFDDYGLYGTGTGIAMALHGLGQRFLVDDTAVASETSLQLWDVTAAGMVRVTRGASDSGGTNFRLLRVPN